MSVTGKSFGIDIQTLLSDETLPQALHDSLKRADVNSDGILSVSELLSVMQSEEKARSDRKLFKRMLIALSVAVLILIAAVCGTVYAIVHLSQKVDDNDGVMVSSSTGEVMATGSVIATEDMSTILQYQGPEAITNALDLNKVVITEDDGSVVIYAVSTVRLNGGKSVTIGTTSGESIFIDSNGISVGDQLADISLSNGTETGRRLLKSGKKGKAVGVKNSGKRNKNKNRKTKEGKKTETDEEEKCEYVVSINGVESTIVEECWGLDY